MQIRPETPADEAGVRAVHLAAFDGPDEAALVDALSRDNVLLLSGTPRVGKSYTARFVAAEFIPWLLCGFLNTWDFFRGALCTARNFDSCFALDR